MAAKAPGMALHLRLAGDDVTLVDEELTFIHPDDEALYNEWDARAFELQVANHELLGVSNSICSSTC